jgi:hypothetical protein
MCSVQRAGTLDAGPRPQRCASLSTPSPPQPPNPQVEAWIQERGTEWVGDSWDELRYIRQAVTFLVIGNKPRKTLENITRELCPILSIQQLYRISTMYWDDKYNTETVSSEVLARMKQAMVESSASSAASHSFLLDDDSTLPFSAADIVSQMDDKVREAAAGRGGAGGGGWGAQGCKGLLEASTPAPASQTHPDHAPHLVHPRPPTPQDLYSALAIPDCLKSDANGGSGGGGSGGGGGADGGGGGGGVSFAFLEKEIKFSQLGAGS